MIHAKEVPQKWVPNRPKRIISLYLHRSLGVTASTDPFNWRNRNLISRADSHLIKEAIFRELIKGDLDEIQIFDAR